MIEPKTHTIEQPGALRESGRKQVPLDRSPVSFACLAPLRSAETLPIAHQSLASIQLRPLPMIERFG